MKATVWSPTMPPRLRKTRCPSTSNAANEKSSSTDRTTTVGRIAGHGGAEVAFTVTAGMLAIGGGEHGATLFYVAYVRDPTGNKLSAIYKGELKD